MRLQHMDSRDNIVGLITKKQVLMADWWALLLLSIFVTEPHACVCSTVDESTQPQKFRAAQQLLNTEPTR